MATEEDLRTRHEEADVIIVQHMSYLANLGRRKTQVIAGKTNVFILAIHAYHPQQMTCNVIMSPPSQSRSSINNSATVVENIPIIQNVLQLHILTGFDTVAQYWIIGKGEALNTLKVGHQLSHLGDPESPMSIVLREATKFIAVCYGSVCN